MKIAITGAKGFIGHHLCQILEKKGVQVVPIPRDLWDLEQKPNLLNKLKGCDAVVHLAAYVHKKYNDTEKVNRLNVAASLALAEEAGKAGVKRFLFTSTTSVYGPFANVAVNEETPPNPHNIYAASKLKAEEELTRLVNQHEDMDLVVLRLPLVYGAHVPSGFKALAKLAIKGWPLPFATLKVQQDMVGVHNLAEMVWLALKSPISGGQTFVVKDGEDMPLKEIIAMLQPKRRLVYFPLWVLKLGLQIGGQANLACTLFNNFKIDNTKARKLLDYRPVATVAQEITAVKNSL